ncbi:UDP-N-acetylmuramoyl-L-alanyl-D-glutamate--2,6-diaminopimelate ligase [Limnohabitans sp. G3-2]|uniref:UDP-N-acetylmuramoyl-L-alanyl-D-glutamate--2, 6-diaminopimelate ligase n=1 Tax=Limnohabitans sp. G3-2 TaxID=1100711 RepID=UPI000C1E4E44|nr:UDP-N-acetylmuramoyl-L-alanyl-D-glutamate--2,6-diaminopimelate ligase [Limnohabitans sp. G3-2]PIT75787.1 UDP-N-acetylmuramoyl-L-alanyl-D-glutamate--2,6-diaminopimelate ligase [Limnohabitans sp. G3-2]
MQVLHNVPEAARWLRTQVKGELRTDSRLVQEGDGFIAWPGAATDGRRYLAQALAQGAAACLMEELDHSPWLAGLQAPQVEGKLACMTGLKAQTGWVADAYYAQPSQALNVLAVTGTNGKTSTAWWLAQALSSPVLQQACGLVGTLGVGQLPHLVSTGMTTPDPVLLQRQFRTFADAGVTHCAIEASSIGLAEHRLDGTRIRVAVFTNFTQDHLDYHGDMETYWSAKAALFDWAGLQAAVINIDDAQGAALAQQLQAGPLQVWTCSKNPAGHSPARLQARALPHADGLAFEVMEGDEVQTLHTRLMGEYNIDNLLGVIGSLRALGFDLLASVRACAHLSAVPGRMQRVSLGVSHTDAQGELNLPLVVVDYAHTPDAIAHALAALRSQAQLRGGRLWCVFGCGGDRDGSKRPWMAAAAEAAADQVVLTSDNPRSEQAEAIVAAMVAGLRNPQQAQVQLDRAVAIAQTLAQAADQDVILVAGKGHETTQEIMGVRHPFSDEAHVRMALQQRAAQHQGVLA